MVKFSFSDKREATTPPAEPEPTEIYDKNLVQWGTVIIVVPLLCIIALLYCTVQYLRTVFYCIALHCQYSLFIVIRCTVLYSLYSTDCTVL